MKTCLKISSILNNEETCQCIADIYYDKCYYLVEWNVSVRCEKFGLILGLSGKSSARNIVLYAKHIYAKIFQIEQETPQK